MEADRGDGGTKQKMLNPMAEDAEQVDPQEPAQIEETHLIRDKNHVFAKDPPSYTLFTTLNDLRTQQMVQKVVPKLKQYSEHHSSLLGQGSHMTYEDLLMGMFLEDEQLVPVRPLLITNYRKCDALAPGWPLEDEKHGLRLFLTNKRLFFLVSSLRVRMCDRGSG
jgi:hypothetical protein